MEVSCETFRHAHMSSYNINFYTILCHCPNIQVIHTFEFMSMIFDNPGVDSTAGDKVAIYLRNKSYNRSTQDTRRR